MIQSCSVVGTNASYLTLGVSCVTWVRVRTYTPPHLSFLSVSTVPRTEYVTFPSFRGSRLKEAGDERDTTEQTHTTAASSPPRGIEWVLTDCVYRMAKSPLFSTLGRGHVGEVSGTQFDLLGQGGDRGPLVRQSISKDCPPRAWAIYFLWATTCCTWYTKQFAARVQGLLKGPGSFWVFNAQICILPHSRDSFSLIFDIYFNTKSW